MLTLLQRVKNSRVVIDGKTLSGIDGGLLVFLAVHPDDTEADCRYLAEKIINYRVFEDSLKKINLSLKQTKGQILLVPQFTLLADTTKGMRPSFSSAAGPQKAQKLCDCMFNSLRALGAEVKTGIFGAHMQVEITNDGPATFILTSPRNKRQSI